MGRLLFFCGVVFLIGAGVRPAAAAAPTLRGGVLVNEILIDPNGPDYSYDTDGNGVAASTDEFIELYNSGSDDLLLDGLELWRGTGRWFTFPEGSLLPAGAFAVIVTGVQSGGGVPAVPGGLAFDANRGTGALANGGDNVVLYDPGADAYLHLIYNEDEVDVPQLDYAGFSATALRVGAVTDFEHDRDGVSQVRRPAGGDDVWQHVDVDDRPASPGFSSGAPTAVRLMAVGIARPESLPWRWLLALVLLTSLSLAGRRRLLRRVAAVRLPALKRGAARRRSGAP